LLDLARRGEDDKASEVIDDIIGDGSGGNPCPALATNTLLNTLTIASRPHARAFPTFSLGRTCESQAARRTLDETQCQVRPLLEALRSRPAA